ncbi:MULTISPECIES: hypothetical protein [unclassified Moorena]|nr:MULTISPECIES: hypothetical protein [unclassified Moorena]
MANLIRQRKAHRRGNKTLKVPRPPNPPSEGLLAWGELADASLF